METILGKKYRWHLPSAPQEQLLVIAGKYNLSLPVVQALVTRGYATDAQIESFLFTSKEKDVANSHLLKDAQKTVERILKAIKNKEKILIFGDYDVDGITSSALMMLALKPLNAQINFFLPNRARDGYGLSVTAVERAARNGYSLIITVDNGITAFEPALKAREFGIDLIITDHHRPHDHVPEAFAIVNPHQNDCAYPFKYFAGVGVTFKIISLLYEQLNLTLPAKVIELLLLGTVADVVPLVGENRFWVRYGLQSIMQQESYALKVLKKNGNLLTKQIISATDIGFSITPQINALGRLEDPRDGVRFLIGDNTKETEQIGQVLLELNQARKEIERSIVQEIVQQIELGSINLAKENVIFAASDNWPTGVIGLVASRLVGLYGKPTLLFHLTKDGRAKGSCRSIAGLSMFDALHSTKDLLDTFGGHAMAAGLSLPQKNMRLLKDYLEEYVLTNLSAADLEQKISVDAELTLAETNKKLVMDMHYLEPFGNENPQPLFFIKNVSLVQAPTLLKGAHVKCTIFADGVIKPIIFFNRPELFDLLKAQEQEPFDVAVHITENNWQDKISIELIGVDIALG